MVMLNAFARASFRIPLGVEGLACGLPGGLGALYHSRTRRLCGALSLGLIGPGSI